MAFKINQTPVLKSPTRTGKLSINSEVQKTSNEAPKTSTNAQFGMRDVPEEFKRRAETESQVREKLKNGELMYGLLSNEPFLEAFDGIKFDYCNGVRLSFPKPKDENNKKKYFVQLVGKDTDVILHSGMIEEGSYISTIQKYYIEVNIYITKTDDFPKEFCDELKAESELTDIDINQLKMSCYSYDTKIDKIYDNFVNRHPYYKNTEAIKTCIEKINNYVIEHFRFSHIFDTEGKEVMVQFPVGTIGDSIGWFAYMERFQQKTKSKLICVMNPAISYLFDKQYPDLTFITPDKTEEYKPYACYRLGLFFKGNTTDQPYDFRYIGNHRTVSKILDVNDDDIAPRGDLSAPRMIKEPYVCIAVQGSAYCKMWTHPHGWDTVIRHLKSIGYRVLCIDKEVVTGSGVVLNHMPWGVEDFTGNKPLQERINLLKDCDFFIGLSSGVSWLAWVAQCPIVMISGFTNPFNEFYTPYRVINTLVCHGCWNDERCDFDHYDFMWCPRNKGTAKAYECSKAITPNMVLAQIKKIPAYQTQLQKSKESSNE